MEYMREFFQSAPPAAAALEPLLVSSSAEKLSSGTASGTA